MKKFRKIASDVVAVQWTGENTKEMIDFLVETVGAAEYTKVDKEFNVAIECDKFLTLYPAQYLIKDDGRAIFVLDKEFFETHYEEVEMPRKEIANSKDTEFESVVRPVIEYLCQNWNPHATIIITPTNAELVCSEMTTGDIFDHLVD